jgi:hypothetical protein
MISCLLRDVVLLRNLRMVSRYRSVVGIMVFRECCSCLCLKDMNDSNFHWPAVGSFPPTPYFTLTSGLVSQDGGLNTLRNRTSAA